MEKNLIFSEDNTHIYLRTLILRLAEVFTHVLVCARLKTARTLKMKLLQSGAASDNNCN